MIELQRGESVGLNYALVTGRTTLEEVEQIRQATALKAQEKSDAGGLGVASSNLAAPTSKIKDLAERYLPEKAPGQGLGRFLRRSQLEARGEASGAARCARPPGAK